MGGDLVLAALRRILAALRGLKLDPVLVGGLGIQAWGRIRQTKDVDLLVATGEPDRERVFAAAEAQGLARDPVKPVVVLERTTILRLAFTDPKFGIAIRVDLLEASSGYLAEVAGRGRPARVFEEDLRVASCEDLILMKLMAGRPIDRADAADLVSVNRSALDRAYLDSQAARLGLKDDLERCERESREC